MTKAIEHLSYINIQDEYGTPKEVFEKACKKYNIHPTIDICGSEKNHVLENYYNKKQNCFTKEINEDFFMNAPYSEIAKFMGFAFAQHRNHNVSVLILAYSKTDTKWWHNYVEPYAEIHFIKGRIRFNDADGNPTVNRKISSKKFGHKQSAPYPSCWIIFRKTSVICESCDKNPLFDNQITCTKCHEKLKVGTL